MDGHEDVGITGIGGLLDFLQTVGLEQFCCYSCRIQVTFRRLTDGQGYVTFTQIAFTIDGPRVGMAARRTAGIQE